MAITRAKKESLITEIHQKAEKSKVAVFVNFRGLSANDTTQLRRIFRKAGMDFKVIKKTLLKKVLGGFGISGDMPELEGELAVAFSPEESPEAAKILNGFAKDHKGLKVLGGVFAKSYVFADFIGRLAALPSREVLLAQVVGMLASPMRGLVGVLGGPIRNMVGVINQISKK